MRYFANHYPEYDNTEVLVDSTKIKQLIEKYVKKILQNKVLSDGDIYVGTSGIAAMFLKLHETRVVESLNDSALQSAKVFIDIARSMRRNKPEDAAAFLCGNAGINAVSAVIHQRQADFSTSQHDLDLFLAGSSICRTTSFNSYGCDEILFGRAGYLSGIYWLNQNLPAEQRISSDIILKLCEVTIDSGEQYSQRNNLKIPMMWKCYYQNYLGAAHGISAILHMILESPMFGGELTQELNQKQQLVKNTIDALLQMQMADGNFPSVLEDADKTEQKLVHWCHGAPGVIYLFAKAFLIFKEQKYLDACLRCGDLVWIKGLLRKGPGICHGVAGNGYVFLLLYRLTNDSKHLYRATRFADFLTNEDYIRESRCERPLSLYEGIAGTVCFLIDLLQPDKASFPFMDVFDAKF